MVDGLLTLVVLGVWVFAIFDVVTSDASSVRHLPKLAWLLLVVFLWIIGAIGWFLLGRPRAESWRPSTGSGSFRWPSRERPARTVVEDPQEIMARIEARDRQLRQWAEEDRLRAEIDTPDGRDEGSP